ncbi:hypothetical protein GGS20DRAFT_539356 [Poronia punctata]|nr:hypothetical protein GGS20DRAFT_539356 [Poronia punctata]
MSSRKIPVTFTFLKKGVAPPLFVAGNFSDPPWQPFEMKGSEYENGEYIFTKNIMAIELPEIQYKFRLGSGDWWTVDPDVETVVDDQGNVNNILRFPDQSTIEGATLERRAEALKLGDSTTGGDLVVGNMGVPSQEATDQNTDAYKGMVNAGSPEYEIARNARRRLSLPPMEEAANIAAEVADSAIFLDDKDVMLNDSSQNSGNDDVLPLFSHECFTSSYESQSPDDGMLALGEESHYQTSETVGDSDPKFDDPRLVHFPSDRKSIMATVRRLSAAVALDPTLVDDTPLSPVFRLSEDSAVSAESVSSSTDDAKAYSQQGTLGLPPTARNTSRTSLQSIAENEEVSHTQVDMASPRGKDEYDTVHRKLSLASSNSNEDEGISMGSALSKVPCVYVEGQDERAPVAADRGSSGIAGSADSIEPTGVRKPINSERPRSSTSMYSLNPKQKSKWLGTFLCAVFVDWVGGFVRWLCRRGGKPV